MSKLLSRLSRPTYQLHLRSTPTKAPLLQNQCRTIIIHEKPNPDDKLKAPDGLWWHPAFGAMKSKKRDEKYIKEVFEESRMENEKLAAEQRRKESERLAKQRATRESEEKGELDGSGS